MDITSVSTAVVDLDEAQHFYARLLGLTVLRTSADALVVLVGRSELHLRRDPHADADLPVRDHLAFAVAADALPEAAAWLYERVELLARDGQVELEGPPGWDSRSVYFAGPSGSVLELIGRRRLSRGSSGTGRPRVPFTADRLEAISEVGVAVPDVPAAVTALVEVGLEVFTGVVGPDFAAVGDDRGLLIVVTEGRPWAPTGDRLSRVAPLSIDVVGPSDGRVLVGGASLRLSR